MKEKYPVIDLKQTGKKIQHFMKRRKLKARDVQAYMGLSAPQSIYHWMEGTSLPSVDHLYALSGLLQVPMDVLICGNKKAEDCSQNFFRSTSNENGDMQVFYVRRWGRLMIYYDRCLRLRTA